MLITDSHGKYELKIDIERAIVYEKNVGLWTDEDISRFHNEYLNKILPMLGGREWLKCTDLREYELSDITEGIISHIALCVEKRLFGGIIIVESEPIKMQMNYSVLYSNMIFSPIAFTDFESAEKWLNSHWI
jgi:hypothetical protein